VAGVPTLAIPVSRRDVPRRPGRGLESGEDVPEARAMTTVEWAKNLAQELLADALPRRWVHTQGVARQTRSFADYLGTDIALVEAAAWLHDIGYAPAVAVTGFHSLDGARYLRDVHAAEQTLCDLVAHHSGSAVEAEERGMGRELAEFGPPDRHARLLSVLTAADMTTGPDGDPMSATARIAEILSRYAVDDVVYRAVSRSGGSLIATSDQVLTERTVWARHR
jgi:putative nucleotidyltransferase with HDIG domain